MAFFDCQSYKLSILNCFFKQRFDYDVVKAELKQLISKEVEVVPQSLVVRRPLVSMYDNCHECISVMNVILIWIFFLGVMWNQVIQRLFNFGRKCPRPT